MMGESYPSAEMQSVYSTSGQLLDESYPTAKMHSVYSSVKTD